MKCHQTLYQQHFIDSTSVDRSALIQKFKEWRVKNPDTTCVFDGFDSLDNAPFTSANTPQAPIFITTRDITTRYGYWFSQFQIEKMTVPEAVLFLAHRRRNAIHWNYNDPDLLTFLSRMNYLPLWLARADDYARASNHSYQSFLELFDEHSDFVLQSNGNNRYEQISKRKQEIPEMIPSVCEAAPGASRISI
jgi:hypothetical protein